MPHDTEQVDIGNWQVKLQRSEKRQRALFALTFAGILCLGLTMIISGLLDYKELYKHTNNYSFLYMLCFFAPLMLVGIFFSIKCPYCKQKIKTFEKDMTFCEFCGNRIKAG